MDGSAGRVNESVQYRLSFALALAVLVAALGAGVLSFIAALDEAHELQDDLLRQVATLTAGSQVPPTEPLAAADGEDADRESRVIVQRLGGAAPAATDAAGGAPLPLSATLPEGMHTLELGGEAFRVLVRRTSAGERVAVAQAAAFRDKLAYESALRTVTPMLVLVPVLLLVVAALVRTMFRPIASLASEIDKRAEQELHPVAERGLPREVRPFARAINRLLARADTAMDTQRRFVADAAHELRTPLTALSLQAERLAQAELPGAARDRLAVLRQGIDRSLNLVDQLLALARARAATELPKAPLSIRGICRRVLEDLMPLAEAKNIDIGIDGLHDATAWASELDLYVLVKNLVGNAIRYTPDGGRVDLAIETGSDHAALHIRDSGPGIPPEQWARVFDPFHRVLGSGQIGSGLGLSIVQAIASRIGAEIRLGFADEATHSGLSVAVRFAGPGPRGAVAERTRDVVIERLDNA